MTESELQELFDRYRAGTASEQDKAMLETWYNYQGVESEFPIMGKERVKDLDLTWEKIQHSIGQSEARRLWTRLAVAASLLILLTAGGYLLLSKQRLVEEQNIAVDIKPGGNRAILLLSDGKKIELNHAPNGILSKDVAADIYKDKDGLISYHSPGTRTTSAESNTLLTPRGGKYHVILVDGSQVWLNSASSIKYPTIFTGPDRTVEITGEAYFEVAHNAAKPFRVLSRGQTVTVLGTHFDVNSYSDEPAVLTTLLEGKVKVSTGTKNSIINPGQQAVYANNELKVVAADTEDVMAWKNGMFRFDEETLESIMRKLSRWYNVDIEYQDEAVKGTRYTGIITHFSNISKVLHMLELTSKVKFKIAGDKIIVSAP